MEDKLSVGPQHNWAGLQQATASGVSALLASLAWLTWFRQLSSMAEDPWLLIMVLVAAALCLLAAWGRRVPLPLICMVQVVVPFLVTSISFAVLGHQLAVAFFAVPVIVAAFLLSPQCAIGTAVAACTVVLMHPPASRELFWASLFLIGFSGAISAFFAGQLRTALWQAWRATEEVAALTREVRARQEEVNRLNKALTTANGLLKRSLSELALARNEALEARRLKEQFATTVSHELRTPLNIILGFIEVMQCFPEVYRGVTWTPELRRDISEIEVSARYLSELVDDILDLARIQALKMPIRREETDIGDLIREVANLTSRLLLKGEKVSLRLDIPDQLPHLYIDRTRIQQAFLNLLANACRFTEAGHISIGARVEQEEVVVSVSDTGTGIPPEKLDRIFDEFSQAESGGLDSFRSGGTGLGLAIARRFINMHGGRIWAESQPGQGSTFWFTLPLVPKQVATLLPPAPDQVKQPGASPKVIVVDDGEAASFMSRHLEGFEVIQAPDLGTARGLIYEWHPQAVIVNVPPESREARFGPPPRILPEPVPVLQCTLPLGRWLSESGLFDDWLVKPVNSEKLLSAIAKYPSARRILVVDDDSSFVHLIGRFLEAQGDRYEVVLARDGESALRLAKESDPDLVLLDIALPGIDGREVASALRQSQDGRELPIVAVTALQPGVESIASNPRTFAVSSSSGFSEEEILLLVKACLANLKPAYGLEEPLSES